MHMSFVAKTLGYLLASVMSIVSYCSVVFHEATNLIDFLIRICPSCASMFDSMLITYTLSNKVWKWYIGVTVRLICLSVRPLACLSVGLLHSNSGYFVASTKSKVFKVTQSQFAHVTVMDWKFSRDILQNIGSYNVELWSLELSVFSSHDNIYSGHFVARTVCTVFKITQ